MRNLAQAFIIVLLFQPLLMKPAFAPPLSFYIQRELFEVPSPQRVNVMLRLAATDVLFRDLVDSRDQFDQIIWFTQQLTKLAASDLVFERIHILDIAEKMNRASRTFAPAEDLEWRADADVEPIRAKRPTRDQVRRLRELAENLFVAAAQNMESLQGYQEALQRLLRGVTAFGMSVSSNNANALIATSSEMICHRYDISTAELFLRIYEEIVVQTWEDDIEEYEKLLRHSRNLIPPTSPTFQENSRRRALERFLGLVSKYSVGLWKFYSGVPEKERPIVRTTYKKLREDAARAFKYSKVTPLRGEANSALEALEWSTLTKIERAKKRCWWTVQAAAKAVGFQLSL